MDEKVADARAPSWRRVFSGAGYHSGDFRARFHGYRSRCDVRRGLEAPGQDRVQMGMTDLDRPEPPIDHAS
ncbi:hypothetical protein [Mesorhizobium sp. B2-7-2]|uniref:hypothetical protein n=1 Tax=Mesorhizobium sp. B2-7-2 TaxID=2589908 RepID=UPI001125C60F|nr:hypothetical protein [Mesorhizobium sp. B2-7-2]TPJ24307.1 hypothetical protein FJ425_21035 [Mesorhizobium sp. B2-7-2]